MSNFDTLHAQALDIARSLRQNEKTLIALLMPIDNTKGFLRLGYSSLFSYCVNGLGLSESQALTFIAIARKSETVPELNHAVQNNIISVSNASRVVSVINPTNKSEWLEKAATLPKRELEREVVKENPRAAIRETIKPVSENLLELRIGISPELEKKVIRAKEIASGQLKKPVNHEMLLDEALSFYLRHKDPLEKAKHRRLCPGRVKNTNLVTRSVPKAVQHQISLRDRRQCQYRSSQGIRCGETYWVETHHLRPWAQGGGHELDNLTTLCSRHHQLQHSGELLGTR